MHRLGICHRDLKPENMLLDYKQNLKIADFGLSNLYSKGDLLSTPCGSPGYAAPEMILNQQYNGLCTDIWSCGIILFAMLCGYLPFDNNDENVLYEKIIIGKYILPNVLSPLAKDLISRILVTDPNQRFTIDQIRSHPWYNLNKMERISGLFISVQPIPIDSRVVNSMKAYGYDEEEVKDMLINNKHNNATTLYYMSVKKNMKKGISSISDLISRQFLQYIHTNQRDPEFLILTKVNSSIHIDNSSTCIVSNSLSQKNSYYQAKGGGEAEQCDNNKTYTFSQDISVEDIGVSTGANSTNNKKRSSEFKNSSLNLENIIEMNEKVETFGNAEPKITRFKGLKKLNHLKVIQKEIPLMAQLKSQYEKYVSNPQVKKQQAHFVKGFLQTSMSFHKNGNNHQRHASYDNNNISTTPSNNNSKSPTPKNKNGFVMKKLIIFANVNQVKRKRCFSQPKKERERTKQHLSSNARSTDHSSNRHSTIKKKILFSHQKKHKPINTYGLVHCKASGLNGINLSANQFKSKQLYRKNKDDTYKKRRLKSMEEKKVDRNVFFSLQSRKKNANGLYLKQRITTNKNKNILSYQKMSLNRKLPFKSKGGDNKRCISEPKKPTQFNRIEFAPKKPQIIISPRKRLHLISNAASSYKKQKNNRQSNDVKHAKNIQPLKYQLISHKVSKASSTEKLFINIKLQCVHQRPLFNFPGRYPNVHLSCIKGKLSNGNTALRYSNKQQKGYRNKSTFTTHNKVTPVQVNQK